MQKIIDTIAMVGFCLVIVSALTFETHVTLSLITCLIGALLITPHLRLTYLRESR